MTRVAAIVFALLPLAVAPAPAAAPADIPVVDFARLPQNRGVQISPDGAFIAANSVIGDHAVLSVVRLSDHSVQRFTVHEDNEVIDFFWANAHQVVYSVGLREGFIDKPQPTGWLFVADAADGSNRVLYRGEVEENWAPAYLLSVLPDDPGHVLIQVDVYSGHDASPVAEAFRVDLDDRSKQRIAKAPARGLDFRADGQGSVRLAYGLDAAAHDVVWYRADERAAWKLVTEAGKDASDFVPMHFDRSNANVYYACDGEFHRGGVCLWHVDGGERRTLWSGKVAGAVALLPTSDHRDAFAIVSMPGLPQVALIDAQAPDAKLLAELHGRFPGELVIPAGATRDGNKRVVSVSSDTNPGAYYLYDVAARSLTRLLSERPWIRPETMAPMVPVELSARDGLRLHGYLTRPLGAEQARGLPLVVLVHGGPFHVHDEWEFVPEVQLLASRGYAVLQVNFRGSSGYGKGFLEAGYREWGGKMQDDVTDATRWAVAEGIADPRRICIVGSSYGGYAALEGAVKEPDLYQCAIGIAGPYDLRLMHTRGDIRRGLGGEAFLKETLGDDPGMLAARSPIEHLDRLKASVLLAVGGADRRVPPVHGEDLHAALARRNIAHDWIYHDSEGHGFFELNHRVDLYERMLALLDRRIGARRLAQAPGQ